MNLWTSIIEKAKKWFRRMVKCLAMHNPILWAELLPLMITAITVEHWRPVLQSDGSTQMVMLSKQTNPNDITNAGKNDILGVYFKDGTQTASGTWRIGLVNATGFTTFAPGDTMATHGGWAEYTTYSQTTRPAWTQGTPASQSITNAAAVQFDMTGTGTVQGIIIVSDSTKGGSTGMLWSGCSFSPTVPVVNGDQLRVTYTLGC